MAKNIKKGKQPDDKKLIISGRRFEGELTKVKDPATQKLIRSLAVQAGLMKKEN